MQSVRDRTTEVLPDAVVEELAACVDSAFPRSVGLVAVADRSGVVFREDLAEPPRAELLRVGALPSLSPVIEHRQTAIPFVLVVADRRGGDLYWSGNEQTGSTSVESDFVHIRKVQAGGWSHKSFQQRAENAWEHTAEEIATEIVHRVEVIRPRVIALAGDVRVTEMIGKRLPDAIAPLVRAVPGSRSADGSDDLRETELRRWLRSAIAEDTAAALRLFDQEVGQRDRAANGVEATFAAFREGRVDTLLIHDDPDEECLAYFVPGEPNLVATDEQTINAVGRDDAQQARMVDIALRAAILTGAGIRIVPMTKQLNDGIGAVLRW